MFSIGHERIAQRGMFRIWIVAPFIYGMMIPLAFLDLCSTVYQTVAFPAYGIPCVVRRKYVRLAGRGAGMVKRIDRFNCMYCSYANGVIAYVRAIGMETEKYWCPIKYQARKDFLPPHPQTDYASQGDTERLAKIVKTG
jgi:hypothetical protein